MSSSEQRSTRKKGKKSARKGTREPPPSDSEENTTTESTSEDGGAETAPTKKNPDQKDASEASVAQKTTTSEQSSPRTTTTSEQSSPRTTTTSEQSSRTTTTSEQSSPRTTTTSEQSSPRTGAKATPTDTKKIPSLASIPQESPTASKTGTIPKTPQKGAKQTVSSGAAAHEPTPIKLTYDGTRRSFVYESRSTRKAAAKYAQKHPVHSAPPPPKGPFRQKSTPQKTDKNSTPVKEVAGTDAPKDTIDSAPPHPGPPDLETHTSQTTLQASSELRESVSEDPADSAPLQPTALVAQEDTADLAPPQPGALGAVEDAADLAPPQPGALVAVEDAADLAPSQPRALVVEEDAADLAPPQPEAAEGETTSVLQESVCADARDSSAPQQRGPDSESGPTQETITTPSTEDATPNDVGDLEESAPTDDGGAGASQPIITNGNGRGAIRKSRVTFTYLRPAATEGTPKDPVQVENARLAEEMRGVVTHRFAKLRVVEMPQAVKDLIAKLPAADVLAKGAGDVLAKGAGDAGTSNSGASESIVPPRRPPPLLELEIARTMFKDSPFTVDPEFIGKMKSLPPSESSSSSSSPSTDPEMARLLDGQQAHRFICEEQEAKLVAESCNKAHVRKKEEEERMRDFLDAFPNESFSPLSSEWSIEQGSPTRQKMHKDIKFPGDPQLGDVPPHPFMTTTPARTMPEERHDSPRCEPSTSASPSAEGSPMRAYEPSPTRNVGVGDSPYVQGDSPAIVSGSRPNTADEPPRTRAEGTAGAPPSWTAGAPPSSGDACASGSRDDPTTAALRETLRDFMARRKREIKEEPQPIHHDLGPPDPYANAEASIAITRGKTGVVYDKEMLKHKCEWDTKHPECPQRLYVCVEKCHSRGLLALCKIVQNDLRTDLYPRILTVHTEEHYDALKDYSMLENDTERERVSSIYDSVFFNVNTFDAACRALSSTLNLVLAVAKNDVMNGLAFVRPPGHHAMADEFNGYCFFNNAAIAAEACIRDKLKKRILIVDIDVHHGQSTQQVFYERDDVLYFSIHRYEHGSFWPNLKESNFNYIGKGKGLGYNINVPLNATGLTDADYIAIILQILLPVGFEFDPDLVIVSAGYDAVVGCPEGRMNVTPGFYSHLIHHLHSLARGQVAVILEGGYFLPTLAEGVCLTLKTLLGGPCPRLDPVTTINPSVIESITNVKRSLFGKWKCFSVCELVKTPYVPGHGDRNTYKICYTGGEPAGPPFPTRRCYPENTIGEYLYYGKLNKALREKYRTPVELPVKFVYHEAMLLHQPSSNEFPNPPERPTRLMAIWDAFTQFGLSNRLMRFPLIARQDWTVYSPHIDGYFDQINIELPQHKDLFVNECTHDAVDVAVNSVLALADEVMKGHCRGTMALIRPPGHHAEHNRPMGFCLVNNVGVCANYLRLKYNVQKILIVDFDIHHGNGTQNIFYDSPHVMYISIHKDNHGKFFPLNSHRSHKHDGHGPGKGYNMNIPLNKDVMGDTEYVSIFQNIILPAGYAYDPDVVIVSAGFDAGVNDLLGGYKVHPEMFGHMIHMLKSLAGGRVLVVLEGGYNKQTTSYGMAMCAKALLGDPIIMPKNLYATFSEHAIYSIREVTNHFRQYFGIFECHRRLPNMPMIVKNVDRFTADLYSRQLTQILDPEMVDNNEYVEEQMRQLDESEN